MGVSFNGRTTVSKIVYLGSNPSHPAKSTHGYPSAEPLSNGEEMEWAASKATQNAVGEKDSATRVYRNP